MPIVLFSLSLLFNDPLSIETIASRIGWLMDMEQSVK
jgi:hypothetical protein